MMPIFVWCDITHFLECSQDGKQLIEIMEIYTQNIENQLSIAITVEEIM